MDRENFPGPVPQDIPPPLPGRSAAGRAVDVLTRCRTWFAQLSPRVRWACGAGGLGLVLLVVLVLALSGGSSSSLPYYDGSPADPWLGGTEWNGRMSSGTIDPTGQGNDVYSVDGEVLDLPD